MSNKWTNIYDENANMLGILQIDLDRVKSSTITIPVKQGRGVFGELVLAVDILVLGNGTRMRALRANRSDLELLCRCRKFFPASV